MKEVRFVQIFIVSKKLSLYYKVVFVFSQLMNDEFFFEDMAGVGGDIFGNELG